MLKLSTRDTTDSATRREFAQLAGRAEREDGQSPFNEQTQLDLDTRVVRVAEVDGTVAAVVVTGGPEIEFAVDPGFRRRGIGGAILEQLVAESAGNQLTAWAHGNHAGAQALADRYGFQPIRTLLQLRASVPPDSPGWKREDLGLSAFTPGHDDADWIELNARAFATHPEQGRLTLEDLRARMGEPWFNPGDFLLARDRDGALVGYCWLKIDPNEDGPTEGTLGEIYVIGVDPARSGQGIGRSLMAAGLERLRARGVQTAFLYVEGDNTAALRLYRPLGFTDHTMDVRYRRPATVQR